MKHMKKNGGKIKFRHVIVVEPIRSTITPKKGTERAVARKRVIIKHLKTTLFQPKVNGMFKIPSNIWLGGFMRIGKAVMRWMRNKNSTASLAGPSQRESTHMPAAKSPSNPQVEAAVGM